MFLMTVVSKGSEHFTMQSIMALNVICLFFILNFKIQKDNEFKTKNVSAFIKWVGCA